MVSAPGNATVFQGPLKVGLQPASGNPNQLRQVGNATIGQVAVIPAGQSLSTAAFPLLDRNGNNVVISAGAYIDQIIVDTKVTFGTAATLSIDVLGTSGQFATAVAATSVGRQNLSAFSLAQLTAMGPVVGGTGGSGSTGTNAVLYGAFAATDAGTGVANIVIEYLSDY